MIFAEKGGNKKVSPQLDSSLELETPSRPITKKNPKQHRVGADKTRLIVSASTVEKWKSELTEYVAKLV